MKFLHLSDLHIGKSVNEFPMIEDQRYILEEILRIAKEQNVDAMLIAGDIYDKSNPSAEAVSLLDWFLNRIADANVPCFATSGNHDSAERIAYASGLLKARGIYLSPVFDGSIEHVTLSDEHGPVTFWLMPFLKPSHVRAFMPEAEIGSDYTLACRAVIDACEVNESERNVILSHQFVTAAGCDTERTESELSLGGMDNVDFRAYDAFDYVALGHVHRPQRVGRDTVRYSGSLLKYSFSEARGVKSVPLVTLGEKGDVSVELIPLTPLHDLREIRGPLEELLAKDVVATLGAAEREDYLRVVLTDEHPVMDALARMRAVYPNVMALEYDNTRTRTLSTFSEQEAKDIHRMNPLELFQEFYEKTNGTSLSKMQEETVRAALAETENEK